MLRAVLIEQLFFAIFLFFFLIKTGNAGKTGKKNPKFGNLAEEKIFGTLRIPVLREKMKENMENTKKLREKKKEGI